MNEIQIVTELDADLDPRSFEFGDIKLGDISIDVPDGRSSFQTEIDFTQTRGFVLRISAVLDLYQQPARASWLFQAIDPLTGEVLEDTTRGLLAPNNALGIGAGFVNYTIKPGADLETGDRINASARVLMTGYAPEDTEVLSQAIDAGAPTSRIAVARIGTTDDFQVNWNVTDDNGGSGVKHVTLYVAENGGDFRIWQRMLTDASGTLVFEGEAGKTYEFLALATDVAGNRELPKPGVNAVADGSSVNLGALPGVPGTTPPDFGQAPAPSPEPSTNALVLAAEANVPAADPLTSPSEFDRVVNPFVARAFATGVGQSAAGIGPMAIVETPDGDFLISGGANRGSLWRFDPRGGAAGEPLATLDVPIFNMAFDGEGRLWATTGGGALALLDPATGQILDRFGDGVTIALAVHPETGQIFVSTNEGISTFDPATGLLEQWSRDENLRVGSLAFDGEGNLWAVTWPDRTQVVRFTDRKRAETMLTFEAPADSLAFGQQGTALEGLLFVSHTSGAIGDDGLAAQGSELTMVDLATLRRVAVASSGSRGDVVHTTSDGRLLISQSNQVDVVAPATAPTVVATNPPAGAQIALPQPFLSVTFDQDMFAGAANAAGSVLNPQYYTLQGAVTGAQAIRSVTYDATTRTAYIAFGSLLPDAYTLTVGAALTSQNGQRLGANYATQFEAFDDISALVDVTFSNTRLDRLTGTITYEVMVTNRTDGPIRLPALLTIDPLGGFTGVPVDAAGQSDDGRWLVDLAGSLPPDGILQAGQATSGRTVSISTGGNQRLSFATGIVAGMVPNTAPVFTSTPPAAATIGQALSHQVAATDAEGHAIVFGLLSGPAGMTIDATTGLLTWTPPAGASAETAVVVEAFDTRGAVSLQRFVLAVAGGNRAPTFTIAPSRIEGAESGLFEFQLAAVDPDLDALTYWADGLPAGASFDPATRIFSWLSDFQSAGTYSVRFFVTDGTDRDEVVVDLLVAELNEPPQVVVPADRVAQEGAVIHFRIQARAESDRELTFASDGLPFGATLNPTTGEFEWVPSYIQAGVYTVPFFVSDGEAVVAFETKITVLPANAAPVFDQQDGWQVLEGQQLVFTAFAFDPDNPYYTPALRTADGTVEQTTNLPQTVTVEAIGALPEGATFDPVTLELRWAPTNGQAGTYEFRFRATDTGGDTPLTSEIVVPVTVFNQNRRPSVTPIENVTVPKDTVLEIPVEAFDADGNPLVLRAVNESPFRPLPEFVTFIDNGDGTGTIRLAPGANQRGDHTIVVIATDNGDGLGEPLSGGYTFNISVTSPNEAPVLSHLGTAVAVVGETLRVPVFVADMDQDALSYLVSGLPGATITATGVYGQALLEWTPVAGQIGTHDAVVTATDSGNGVGAAASDSATFRVVVRAANTAPQIAPVGDRQATEGQPLAFSLRGADTDGDALTFGMAGAPEGAVLDPVTGQFGWTPPLNASGSYTVTFTVSDGHSSSSETVTLTVANANQAPQFVPAGLQLVREGGDLVFRVVAGDADGEPVQYSLLSAPPPGALFVANRGEFQWSPGFDQAGEHVLRFRAVDPSGASDEIEVVVRVADINRAPVIDEGYHAFLIGEEKRFLVSASDADTEDSLTFTAEGLPEGATLDPVTGEFVWNPGPGQAGDYVVTLIADDGDVKVRRSILVRALLEPIQPTVRLELTPSFPAVPGQQVLVHPVADSLADVTSLRVWLDGQELTLDANGRTTVIAGAPGKYEFVVTATDADGGTRTITQQLKVRDPADRDAPVVGFLGEIAGALIDGEVPVLGSIADANLDSWTLELLASDGTVTKLGGGDDPLSGELGTLDARKLADGFYSLRLTARDVSGRVSVASVEVELQSGADKLGRYTTSRVDYAGTLGTVPFALTRYYDSVRGDWTFLGLDVDIETNVGSRPGPDGALPGFELGSRLYLTLPSGERAGFTFAPRAETIGNQTFYRPAWVADGAHGFALASVDVQLRKIGGKFYDVDTGIAYNPAAAVFGDRDYVLTAPDGTRYRLDSSRGTVAIESAAGTLLIGDGGITALGGEALRFVRDAQGRVSRLTAPDGTSIVYEYGANGLLSAVRDLATGDGARYGYANALLTLELPSQGAGRWIAYDADGSVRNGVVRDDLASAATFTGSPISGNLGAAGSDSFGFTIRESELRGTPNGTVILRVATTGDVLPGVTGVEPLASAVSGGQRITLFAVTEPGLFQLTFTGSGSYSADLRVAGDIDGNAKVDGADQAAIVALLAGSDITGDGVVNATDRQLIAANYGFAANLPPQLAAVLPDILTHVDLPAFLDLKTVATDPDGDRVYYRIVEVTNGTASLTADGRGLIFIPANGASGTASVRVAADDGFGSSAAGVIDIAISDAPLLAIDFEMVRPHFSDPGLEHTVRLIGTFADQEKVFLPYSYVQASVGDPTILALADTGSMLSLKEGATHLKVTRGTISNATTVTVGEPVDANALMTAIYNIDAYPDTVTLLPGGGTRQIVTSLDPDREFFANGAAAGTTYVSRDSAIVTVDANGLMRGVGVGSTTVVVINRWGEDRIEVTVSPPAVGDNVAVVGQNGAIVENAEGVQVAFGPGALSGNATVTIDSLTEAELPIPMVGGDTGMFSFVAAFDLQVEGAEIGDALQVAVPVGAGLGQPGDQVWFFTSMMLPVGENGEEIEVWTVVDSGTIDADGMARAKSPPFPGLSNRGKVLIARAAQPLPTLRINAGFTTAAMIAFAPAIGIAAVGGLGGAVVGLGIAGTALAMLPLLEQLGRLSIYKRLAGMQNEIEIVNLDPDFTPAQLNNGGTIFADFPPEEFQSDRGPVILDVTHELVGEDGSLVEITGRNFLVGSGSDVVGDSADDLKIILRHGTREIEFGSDKFAFFPEGDGLSSVTFFVPKDILLGATEIFIERPAAGSPAGPDGRATKGTEQVRSIGITIDNKAAYAFAGDASGVQVIDRAQHTDENAIDELIRRIDLGAPVNEIVVTNDLGAAFVATSKGIAVIDTLALRQFDVNAATPEIDQIVVPGGAVTALAVDPANRYLYAAALGKVYVINIDPGKPNYLKVLPYGSNAIDVQVKSGQDHFGHITSMALNSDGTRLYVGVPVSELFGARPWANGRTSDPGFVMVINVDEDDRPQQNEANVNRWREVVDKIPAGIEVFDIQATSDPKVMVFVSRGDRNRGVKIVNAVEGTFTHRVTEVSTQIMDRDVGVEYVPFSIAGIVLSVDKRRTTDTAQFSIGKANDLNVHNASGVAVTPDGQYMFVADWGLPTLYWYKNSQSHIRNASSDRSMGIYEPSLAEDVDELYNIGSKILVIKDPFGPNRQLLGATTPIPMAFLEELRIDSSGKKLYANYRGAGNLVVIDIDQIRDIDLIDDRKRMAIDHPDFDTGLLEGPRNIYLDAIDVSRHGRGLALQTVMAVDLIAPSGVQNIHGPNPSPLVFKWEIDPDLIPLGDELKTSFFLSTQTEGQGLWPDDPIRDRTVLIDSDPSYDGDDTHPSRIYTVFDLEPGKWRVKADGGYERIGDLEPGQYELEFDNAYARSLTGGQTYFWGVQVEDVDVREFSAFRVAPAVSATGTFNGVTILTHGFELSGLADDYSPFSQPDTFKELGRMIAGFGGDGVVLLYDKTTGNWVDMDTEQVVTGQGLAAYAGKPVVLISDWVKESAYAETGFSEAAADALFAAIMDLDAEAGGTLLDSPLHFIGHSRGTSVNSEIIQRLGWYREDVQDIHMTTLDPHDFKQESLDIEFNALLNLAKYVISFYALGSFATGVASAIGGAATTISSGGAALPATGAAFAASGRSLLAAAKAMKWAVYIQKLQDLATTLGVQIDPIGYGDFGDPDVKLWNNIGFTDNYYQTNGSPTGFTLTANGRDIGPTSISRWLGGPDGQTAGFTTDDFALLGVGGPHARVLQWYTGTIDTSLATFKGSDIYRRITDEGIRPRVFNVPTLDKFNDQPWYFITPGELTGTPAQRIGAANQQAMNEPTGPYDYQITDGIGMGWYYSVAGGGLPYRPSTGSGNVPVTTDNTEPGRPAGSDAVANVFNGDFEQGTRESLTVHLERIATGELDDEAGRFPISYEIPGFSFHGGSGFKIDLSDVRDLSIFGHIDVGALFTVNTNPQALIKKVLVKLWEDFFDNQVRLANGFAIGSFKLPTLGRVESYLAGKVVGWVSMGAAQKLALVNRYFKAANSVSTAAANSIEAIDKGIDQIMEYAGVPGFKFGEGTNDEVGLEKFKQSVSNAIEKGFDKLFPNQDNYALIMGASGALERLVDAFLPSGPPDGAWELLKNNIKQYLPGLDSVTHNTMFVPADKPYLSFKIYRPYMLQSGATARVTFAAPGLPTIDAEVANQTPGSTHVDLGTGFFDSAEFSVLVPEIYRGRAATVTITHANMAPPSEFKQDLADAEYIEMIDSGTRDLATAAAQIYLLDDIRFTSLAASGGVMPGTPLLAAEGEAAGPAAERITLDQAMSLADDARQAWLAAGLQGQAAADLAALDIAIADLADGALATYSGGTIFIDADAAGRGWFVDATPADNGEFSGTGVQLVAAPGGAAAQRYDLLTVLTHEMGHALGLGDAPNSVAAQLMSDRLGIGVRRLSTSADLPTAGNVTPTTQDLPTIPTITLQAAGLAPGFGTLAAVAAFNGQPATTALANGDFAAAATGWVAAGGASVTGGRGVLAEDKRFLTSLRQGFAVPVGVESISFRLVSTALGQSAGLPPDAFEAALLDPVTGSSLLGTLGGLDLSDSLLNLQADGTIYLAPGVTITGDPLSGQAIVTISLAGVDTSNGALLSFDLIGQGALDSVVMVDDVTFGGAFNSPPVARNDDVTVAEDGSVAIDLLANDTDVDGDPLAVTILTGPATGTLTAPVTPGGAWTFTPDADFSGTTSFTYSISDNLNPPATATVTITVSPVNDLPTLAPVASSSRSQGEAVSIALTASDVEDALAGLTFSLVSGPAGATVSADGVFTWTAAGNGAQPVTVRVTDSDGGVAETSFSITVTAAGNVAPQLAPVADRTVDEGAVLTFALAATDADDPAASLTYSLVSGPAGATVSADGTFAWTATGGASQRDVTVRVTDPDGAFAEATFRIAVNLASANTAPALAAVPDQAIAAGQVLILTLAGSDAEDAADALTYSLVSGPAGAAVSARGQFSWQAGAAAGDEPVTVRVTDSGGLSAERSFRIAVSAANVAPVLAEVADLAVIEGAAIGFDLAGSDADDPADSLTFSLVAGPAGAAVSAQGRFTWTAAGTGDRTVRVRVTDPDGAFAERSFAIAVAPATSEAPVLAPVDDRTVLAGAAVSLQLAAADADDPLSSLVFSLVSGPAGATVSADGAFAWTAAGAGAHDFTVRVTDPDGNFAERSFRVTVSVVANQAPAIAPVAGFAVAEGTAVRLQLGATDPDGPASALRWTLVSGPAGASLSGSGLLTWLAADGDLDGSFTVRVTDALGASDEETLAIEVADVPPTLALTGATSTVAGSSYTVLLGVTDPGADTPIEWVIDWGDGTTPTTVAGAAASATHKYDASGDFHVTARLRNEDGTFAAARLAVAVAARPLLRVTGAAIAGGALHVTFNQVLDRGVAGAQAVSLTGGLTGPVAGVLSFDADHKGVVVTRVDGKPLQYDNYQLVLADSGFVSVLGAVLDGDANGVAGGNYRTSLVHLGAAAGSAALPDFMRGPGEHVDVPVAASGLQVRFASAGGVKTMTFTVGFDPALLRLDGVNPGANLPAGAKLTWSVVPAAGGKSLLRVTIASDTAIAAGSVHLVSLDATVPASAPYGSSEILTVAVERINNAAPSATQADEALQLVGFHGDADADRQLTLNDLWLTSRVALGLDSEFRAWPGAPPGLVADIIDHSPFDSPFVEDPVIAMPYGQPLHRSNSAVRPEMDPIVYGFADAVAKWAGDIHATTTPPPPAEGTEEDAATTEARARSEQAAAEGIAAASESVPAAVIDMNATPLAAGTRLDSAPRIQTALVPAAGTEGEGWSWIDNPLHLIALPLIRPEALAGRRKRRRKEPAE
ncbi:MAG TPA: putative Ig domain-containing protein [Croceibacterium sp.]